MTTGPSKRRLVWQVGYKGGARFDWARRCAKYCRLKKRPKAASLVVVIANYLNAEHGYAWPTNEQLRVDMGDKHVSGVERAILQLDEMGVIERQTVTRHDDKGQVSKSRRIFPCWPSDLEQTPAGNRTPNPESKRQLNAEPITSPKVRDRRDRAFQTEPRLSEHRTPSRPPSRSGIKEDILSLQDKNSVRDDHHVSGVGERAGAIIDALAFIGPGDRDTVSEAAELIRIGRSTWVTINRGMISEKEAVTLLDHHRDAAIRAWLECRPDVKTVLEHISRLIAARQAWPAPGRRAIV